MHGVMRLLEAKIQPMAKFWRLLWALYSSLSNRNLSKVRCEGTNTLLFSLWIRRCWLVINFPKTFYISFVWGMYIGNFCISFSSCFDSALLTFVSCLLLFERRWLPHLELPEKRILSDEKMNEKNMQLQC